MKYYLEKAEKLPDSISKYAKNLNFIMFTPDAIHQRAHIKVVEKYKFKILEYDFVKITERLAERLYQKELSKNKIDSW